MPITVTRLTEPDIPGVITCIQTAFAQDPYNNWVFDAATFSPTRNAVSLTLRCKWGMQHALFFVAKDPSSSTPDQVLGVACWLAPRDPSAPQTWSEWAGDWWLWFSQVRMNLWYGRGGLNVRRYWIWKAAQAQAQAELWDDGKGYYFCNIVTVLPEAQGKGIGKVLFKHVTDLADEEGRKCYLESSRAEPNMAIYERMGFELRREMVCDDEGEAITLYCMMREPKAVGS
ncbi:acyl-CoA N-acyltransferase [Neohortaea acidophila]|uniref:Acyl-CoA N-acyltransferase n=1 Tax=Neohortaea acidophila TaxID=245834 RepID=A0A6A6Q319_9PEZI|nr:acyl-CoA N-acyltransferase [Neohortaea acidophila]KAF2486346.1 acyl-CoA N-acyltransferase [Neohortaea acidophila]